MNNCEKFYKKTGEAIELFYKPICEHSDNYEYEKKKILRKMSHMSLEEQISCFFSWQFLIDIAFLGLNREKIESGVNINWDSYVPANLAARSKFIDDRKSKIPYFGQWLKVLDCKEKYLAEDSKFWILRLRNSFMHGNFVYDYDNIVAQRIKVFEGNANSTDINMHIMFLGLNEFIEDNFHNIPHNDFGIVSEHNDLMALNYTQINTREELKEFLKKNLFIGNRKNNESFYYNGNDIINSSTGEKIGRARSRRKLFVSGDEVLFDTQDFVDSKMKIFSLSDQSIELLIWVLENKYNIYNASKQKQKIFNAIRQYLFPMNGVNKLLHEFGLYCGGLAVDKKDYKNVGVDFKKTFAIFHDEAENIVNTFTILKLYRFLYRIQNKNFEPLNYSLLDCKNTFVSSGEDMQKRIEKYKLQMPQDEAENYAYIETIRNALAHGNVEIKYFLSNEKLTPVIKFHDLWENKKTGDKIDISIFSPARMLDKFLDRIDLSIEFDDVFDFGEFKTTNIKNEREKH